MIHIYKNMLIISQVPTTQVAPDTSINIIDMRFKGANFLPLFNNSKKDTTPICFYGVVNKKIMSGQTYEKNLESFLISEPLLLCELN